ncbi:MAG TPA: class I SAM-dependent methyltransferase [Gaiellaceae bacterium]|nr:class I SAM-dependent methyltransferase [Gaiellaceae bacterium]
MTDERRRLRATFDGDAELYRRARPGYPPELFDDLEELAGLAPGSRVLEIGPGTGQATASLAERGYRVVAVELGAQLAAVARRELARFPAVEVVNASFEEWEPAAAGFDAVVAATAFHWLDEDVRFAKPARLLGAGGALAVIATHHVVPEGGDPFFHEVQDVYERLGDAGGAPGPPEAVGDEWPELDASGLFEPPTVRRYLWERWYTADEYVDVLNTYSANLGRPPAERRALLEELHRRIEARPDPRVRKAYLTVLHVARRRAL